MEQTARMTENAQVALEAAAGRKSFPSLFLARDR